LFLSRFSGSGFAWTMRGGTKNKGVGVAMYVLGAVLEEDGLKIVGLAGGYAD